MLAGTRTNAGPANQCRARALASAGSVPRTAAPMCIGYIAQECFRFPGYLSTSSELKFTDLPNGIRGLGAMPQAGLLQVMIFIGAMEIVTWRYYEGPWPGTPVAGKREPPAGRSPGPCDATRLPGLPADAPNQPPVTQPPYPHPRHHPSARGSAWRRCWRSVGALL